MYYLHPLFIMCVQNAKIKIFPLEQKLENPRKKKIHIFRSSALIFPSSLTHLTYREPQLSG